MNKDKWFSISYLIVSVILFFVLIGIMAWHYFHEHHEDTRTGNQLEQALNQPGQACLMSQDRGFNSIANGVSSPHVVFAPEMTIRGA